MIKGAIFGLQVFFYTFSQPLHLLLMGMMIRKLWKMLENC